MSQRKIVLLLALAVAVAAPATASAAPTVTITGDDGNPATLSAVPFGLRNMDVTVTAAVPATDTGNFTVQVFGPDNVAVTPLTTCLDPEFTTSTRRFADYRGNGTYTVVLRYFAEADTTATAPRPSGATST